MSIKAWRSAWLFLLACLTVCACASGNGATWPTGVVIDPGDAGAALLGGIYAGPPNDPSCCWTRRTATFKMTKNDDATDLVVTTYLPQAPTFAKHPQSYRATVDGLSAGTECCYGPGFHTILFSLPPAVRSRRGVIGVRLDMSQTFIPANEGFPGDTRELAVILRSVAFRSY